MPLTTNKVGVVVLALLTTKVINKNGPVTSDLGLNTRVGV